MRNILFVILGMLYSISHYGQGPRPEQDEFGKWGLVSEDGISLTEHIYDKMQKAGPYFLVESWYYWGALDKEGQEIIPPKYSEIRISGPDMFIVKYLLTYGVLDQHGQVVIEPGLEAIDHIRSDGAILAKRDGQWSYFLHNQRLIDEPIFERYARVPRFSPCLSCSLKEADQKAQKDMLTYIYTHIKYPGDARENGIEGTVVVSFIVNKSGQIREPEVIYTLSDDCDEEALRVILSMPNWVPGEIDGKPVNCRFKLPIKYKLQ
ncbi:MAG: TonB family protein [Saprospiraceae bacterium]|nr:TonB family protein [Saprospiraceae bacterium]